MSCFWKCSLFAALFAMTVSVMPASATVLVNGGFETDASSGAAPVPGATGWDTLGNTNTASDPNDPVRSGIGSLQLVGAGGFGVPTARQEFAVTPGQVVNLQGYHYTPAALPADATFHLFKVVWEDGSGTEIDPIDAGSDPNFIGGGTLLGANPGIESVQLNSGSAVGEWLFAEAQGTAPPTAASVVLLGGLLVDQSAATVYVDDVSATIVPEPTSVALMGLAGLALAARRRRK